VNDEGLQSTTALHRGLVKSGTFGTELHGMRRVGGEGCPRSQNM